MNEYTEQGTARRYWFEEALEPRKAVAVAFDDLPLSYLALPLRPRLALARHFGRYRTVADLLRADEEIRHVRNLGAKSLDQLDDRLRAILAKAEADRDAAQGPLEVLRAVQTTPMAVVALDALMPDGYSEHPWYEADPAAREAIAMRFDQTPIAAWGLSNRSRNALRVSRRYGTVGAVLRADSDIRACRGLGLVTLAELHQRAVAVFRGTDPVNAWRPERSDEDAETR